MKIAFTNINYNNQRYANFSGRKPDLPTVSELAKRLEIQNSARNRPVPIQNLYKNSIDYLKGNLPKEKYVNDLDNILNNIYQSKNSASSLSEKIKLSQKENTFFENMFITFDNLNNKDISDEQLAKNISILIK